MDMMFTFFSAIFEQGKASSFFESYRPQCLQAVQHCKSELDGKRMKIQKSSDAVLKKIHEALKDEQFAVLLKEAFPEDPSSIEKVHSIFKKAAKKDQSSDFRSFLRKQKEQAAAAKDE